MNAPRHTKFYLDKQNAKWAGVCSGVADYVGLDVVWVRVGVILLTLMTGPWTLLAYVVAACVAPTKPRELTEESPEKAKFWQGVRASPKRTIRDVRSSFRDIDRRLADIETYVTSPNAQLAREIDQLR